MSGRPPRGSRRTGGPLCRNRRCRTAREGTWDAGERRWTGRISRRARRLGWRTRPHPGAQDFRHAPRLGHAAPRGVRLDGVEDLADRADAGLVQMRYEAVEKAPGPCVVFRVHLEPRVDEGADEPRPHRALMVGGVSRPEIAAIG